MALGVVSYCFVCVALHFVMCCILHRISCLCKVRYIWYFVPYGTVSFITSYGGYGMVLRVSSGIQGMVFRAWYGR